MGQEWDKGSYEDLDCETSDFSRGPKSAVLKSFALRTPYTLIKYRTLKNFREGLNILIFTYNIKKKNHIC